MDIFDILLDILLKPPQPFIGLFFIHIIAPMSKTITRKKSKQKEIDPKFGVSEWDPAELHVRQTRHGTYESRPPPRGGTWRDQIMEEGYKLRQRQREADSPEFICRHSRHSRRCL